MATGVSKTRWEGSKSRSAQHDANVSNLVKVFGDGSSENRLYYSDNLKVLKTLCNDNNIKGKVTLVYIDPPYSTNSVFKTRENKNAYTDLLVGEEYINFIKERVQLLHELLSDDGSIYIHLDSKMVFQIKMVMDEVFGAQNFRNLITRKKCKSKNYTRNSFGNISDYILFYVKGQSAFWKKPHQEWTDEGILKEYPYIEENTGRRYKRVPIHAPGERNGETGKSWKRMLPPKGKHWQFTPAKLDIFDTRGEIYWSRTGNPRRKVFLDQSSGIAIPDIWLDCLDASNQNTKITGYPTEKNPEVLKRVIEASSRPGDLVLDCFVGSGTTLTVASELGRKWIGVDIEHEAIETTLNRFLNGTRAMGDYVVRKESRNGVLPLFQSTKKPKPGGIHKVIKNFAFFAEKEKFSEAIKLVKKWETS